MLAKWLAVSSSTRSVNPLKRMCVNSIRMIVTYANFVAETLQTNTSWTNIRITIPMVEEERGVCLLAILVLTVLESLTGNDTWSFTFCSNTHKSVPSDVTSAGKDSRRGIVSMYTCAHTGLEDFRGAVKSVAKLSIKYLLIIHILRCTRMCVILLVKIVA
jgi:hypothetical protein